MMDTHGIFVSVVVGFLVLLCAASIHGQSTDGFISIDVGKKEGKGYPDKITNIPYVPDLDYISSGQLAEVSETYKNSNLYPYYSDQDYDLRYFPDGTRNCYMIPVQKDQKYLVRATFFYGNYDGTNNNTQFDLYLGINYWKKINIREETISYRYETIAMATSVTMSVCLVNTNSGIPFISSLELRPLNNTLYPLVNSSQSLVLFTRSNQGGDFLRYPNDIFDRIWSNGNDTTGGFTSLYNPGRIDTSDDNFGTPEDVMRTALSIVEGYSIEYQIDLGIKDTGFPSADYYLIFQFAELSFSEDGIRSFSVELNGEPIYNGQFYPQYLKTETIMTDIKLSGAEIITLTPIGTSSPPLLNAYELYIGAPVTLLETFAEDVNALIAIKVLYKLQKNWMGDPCRPKEFMWDGLGCKDDNNSPRIISLKLPNSGLTGEIAPSLANLTEIQYIDLSNNGLTGNIPDFFATLQDLNYLDLSNNTLTGVIPRDLLDRSNSGSLKLRVEGNQLCSGCKHCSKYKKIMIIVVSVVGFVVFCCLCCCCCWYYRRKKQSQADEDRPVSSTTVRPISFIKNYVRRR